jgi:hypothetical protein
MELNALPVYDASDNPTGCCPRFNSQGWDGEELHFEDKLFVRVTTKSLFHIPINISGTFQKTLAAIAAAQACHDKEHIVLSHDLSPWSAQHYFAVAKDVPGQDTRRLTGDYLTKVFEGPFKSVPKWESEMETYTGDRGKVAEKIYFFYTTCPRCAKYYGTNYVVAVAKLHDAQTAAAQAH